MLFDAQREPDFGARVGVVERSSRELLDAPDSVAQCVAVHPELSCGWGALAVVLEQGAKGRAQGSVLVSLQARISASVCRDRLLEGEWAEHRCCRRQAGG